MTTIVPRGDNRRVVGPAKKKTKMITLAEKEKKKAGDVP